MNSATDITAKRNALMRLLRDNQAKTLLLESILLGEELVVIGNTMSSDFYWVSPHWEGVTGYSFDELTSMDYFDIIHPDDVEDSKKAVEYFQNNKNIGYGNIFPNRYRHKNGGYLNLGWMDIIILSEDTKKYTMRCRVLTDEEFEKAKLNLKKYYERVP